MTRQKKIKFGDIIELKGMFQDQRGTAICREKTGHNGHGVPCRKYVWLIPDMTELKGQSFEAFDDQIKNARID